MNLNKNTEDISERIIKMRKQHGWKQQELADIAGITQGALSQIENGKRTPTLLVLRKLARAFETSVEVLVGEPEYAYPEESKIRDFYQRYQIIDDLAEDDKQMIIEMIRRLKK